MLMALLLALGCADKPTGAAADSAYSPADTGEPGDSRGEDSAPAGDSEQVDSGETGDTASPAPAGSASCPEVGGFERFITRDGDRLMDGDRELRFVSFNVPNLHMLEDPDWHLPDPWEQADALCTVAQLGGQVARIYVPSVGDSGVEVPRHVTAPGVFSEDLFVAFDHMLAEANRYGVRLIVPLVDQWSWWGGVAEYAAFRGLPPEDFWTDAQVREDFKATVEHLLTRTNTVTGVPYREDPAILAWETGNELEATSEWTADIAAFIKDLDPNHLVMDGAYGIDPASLSNPDVDIVSNHYYWPEGYGEDYAAAASADQALAAGQRPFVLGEFGFLATWRYEALLDVVQDEGVAGAMIWSLRFHDVGGGFYWHTEIQEPGWLVRAYHWPGFDSGDAYDERAVMALMRERAFAIQGFEAPPLPPPDPPELLPIEDVVKIHWRGSAGADRYTLERAEAAEGPWEAVAEGFHDANAPNEAVVADTTTASGQEYYYRLRAGNDAGDSEPSEVQGPIASPVR
jgi:hypothetical protein